MRDPDTIVIAPTIQRAALAGWCGYSARHVITPQTTVRLRGRTVRHVHIVGYYPDDPDLADILGAVEPCALAAGMPHATFH